MIKKLSLLAVASLALLQPALHAAEPGKPAPDFTLTDSAGKPHTLSEHKGKHVVLEWINHECPFVVKHYSSNNMQKLQKEFTDKGVVWYSICSSAPGKQGHRSAEEWAALTKEKNAAPTAVLLDEDGKVGKAYGAKTTPHMFVIDPEGLLIYAGAIDSIKSSDAADIEKADNYVRQALEASMQDKPVANPSTQAYGCSVKY